MQLWRKLWRYLKQRVEITHDSLCSEWMDGCCRGPSLHKEEVQKGRVGGRQMSTALKLIEP